MPHVAQPGQQRQCPAVSQQTANSPRFDFAEKQASGFGETKGAQVAGYPVPMAAPDATVPTEMLGSKKVSTEETLKDPEKEKARAAPDPPAHTGVPEAKKASAEESLKDPEKQNAMAAPNATVPTEMLGSKNVSTEETLKDPEKENASDAALDAPVPTGFLGSKKAGTEEILKDPETKNDITLPLALAPHNSDEAQERNFDEVHKSIDGGPSACQSARPTPVASNVDVDTPLEDDTSSPQRPDLSTFNAAHDNVQEHALSPLRKTSNAYGLPARSMSFASNVPVLQSRGSRASLLSVFSSASSVFSPSKSTEANQIMREVMSFENCEKLYGTLLKDGLLEKRSPSQFKTWQARRFRVHENAILYSEPESWTPKAKQIIYVRNIISIEYSEGSTFTLITAGREEKPYRLRAKSESDALAWVEAIQYTLEHSDGEPVGGGLSDAVPEASSRHAIFHQLLTSARSLLTAPPAFSDRGLRVLCLDGGGSKGVGIIRMLELMEEEIGHPLRELYDFMAGVSIGGAILIACQQCDLPLPVVRNHLVRGMSKYSQDFSMVSLARTGSLASERSTMELVLESCCGDWNMMGSPFDLQQSCSQMPMMIFTTQVQGNLNTTVAVRNYAKQSNNQRPGRRTSMTSSQNLDAFSNQKVQNEERESWSVGEVVWATCAAPPAVPAFVSEDGSIFRDGGLLGSNPTLEALQELRMLCPGKNVSYVHSIGVAAATDGSVRQTHHRRLSSTLSTIGNSIGDSLAAVQQAQNYLMLWDPNASIQRIDLPLKQYKTFVAEVKVYEQMVKETEEFLSENDVYQTILRDLRSSMKV
eukprot:gnl/MRDRNA2_/MRDRNA2_77341_c0_seq2.p1 gnl/MRDRNA2_/MRDRNA2_77341_c0~~gnl/MRDRNA2_/MRDRNA2_77341_c0_seq2.p1  ORF type:complete len:816 (+),score=152.82 gnl/MRDRNA2_/MRDRNA2_77341_c0_seq2:187-2634(+)